MNIRKFTINVFSNWALLILSVAIGFVVSPMMVNKLGNEAYGVWVLIVSMTGYFTILDFGFNGAIVKYMSEFTTLKEHRRASEIYSAAFVLFTGIAVSIMIFASIFALFFKDLMEIENFTRNYLYMVFLVVTLELATKLVFGVNSATLKATHNFFEINVIGFVATCVENSILVYLLYQGYSLLALALLQITMSAFVLMAQSYLVKKKYSFLEFRLSYVNKEVYSLLFGYTIYSFMISVAQKILYYTDSIVIGSRLEVSLVTFYAIPNMIIEYLTSLVWAVIAVLIPIISANDATGDRQMSQQLYVTGTRYSLAFCSPIIFVLMAVGDDFIGMWMGEEFASSSGRVLTILLIGNIFALSQLIAQGILKGIARHKIIAYIFCAEAIVNLVLSVYLAPIFGIEGVALGTTVPLLVSSILIIPYYTCKELNMSLLKYIVQSYAHPLLAFVIPLAFVLYLDIEVKNYFELILLSGTSALAYALYALFFHLERDHRMLLLQKIRIY